MTSSTEDGSHSRMAGKNMQIVVVTESVKNITVQMVQKRWDRISMLQIVNEDYCLYCIVPPM